jgi:hypothetical protein
VTDPTCRAVAMRLDDYCREGGYTSLREAAAALTRETDSAVDAGELGRVRNGMLTTRAQIVRLLARHWGIK